METNRKPTETNRKPTVGPRFQVFSKSRAKVRRQDAQGVALDHEVVDTTTGKTVSRHASSFEATQASLALNRTEKP